LYNIIKSTFQTGRRGRGLFVILGAEMMGQTCNQNLLLLAAAIEIAHRASVIHDDVIDGDEFRRGQPTINAIYGEKIAIIAGDFLIGMAFDTLKDISISNEKLIASYQQLSDLCRTTCLGEFKDIFWENQPDVSFNESIEMEYEKTAAFGETAMTLGSIIANAPEKYVSPIKKYGRCFGLAFQMYNDVRDFDGIHYWSKKRNFSDIPQKKKNPLLIKALDLSSSDEKRRITTLFNSNQPIDEVNFKQLYELIVNSGAREFILEQINYYLSEARNSLDGFNSSIQKTILLKLASREYLDVH